jgi:hypothetical protein
MNDWDRDNLNFLMKATPATLKEWFEQATEDNIAYAQDLLDRYSQELDELTLSNNINKRLERTERYPEAQTVLAKFRL